MTTEFFIFGLATMPDKIIWQKHQTVVSWVERVTFQNSPLPQFQCCSWSVCLWMFYDFNIDIGGGVGRDNVKGKDNVKDSIKSSWISQFLP